MVAGWAETSCEIKQKEEPSKPSGFSLSYTTADKNQNSIQGTDSTIRDASTINNLVTHVYNKHALDYEHSHAVIHLYCY
jgi:hypothetical protein